MKQTELKNLINECIREVLVEEKQTKKKAAIKAIKKIVTENQLTEEEVEEGVFGAVKQALGFSSGKDKEAAEKSFDEVNPKAKTDQSANKAKWMERAKTYSYKGKFVINPKTKELNWEGKSEAPSTGGSSGFGTAQG